MTQLYNEAGKLLPVTLVYIENDKEAEVGEGQKVTVVGRSKGKGFQGVVKRHGMKGAPRSHGHKDDLRRVGSIGSGFPEHVFRGKRMPGHMGSERVTIKHLEVVRIDKENKLIALKGALPGAAGSVLMLHIES